MADDLSMEAVDDDMPELIDIDLPKQLPSLIEQNKLTPKATSDEFKQGSRKRKSYPVRKVEMADESTTSVEDGVLAAVEETEMVDEDDGQRGSKRAKGEKGKMRKVPVPKHRYAQIEENWVNIFTPVVKHLGLAINFDIKAKVIEIINPKHMVDNSCFEKASNYVDAVINGMSVTDAIDVCSLKDGSKFSEMEGKYKVCRYSVPSLTDKKATSVCDVAILKILASEGVSKGHEYFECLLCEYHSVYETNMLMHISMHDNVLDIEKVERKNKIDPTNMVPGQFIELIASEMVNYDADAAIDRNNDHEARRKRMDRVLENMNRMKNAEMIGCKISAGSNNDDNANDDGDLDTVEKTETVQSIYANIDKSDELAELRDI